VRALTFDDIISEVGLAAEPTRIDAPRLPMFPSLGEIRARAKRLLARVGL